MFNFVLAKFFRTTHMIAPQTCEETTVLKVTHYSYSLEKMVIRKNKTTHNYYL